VLASSEEWDSLPAVAMTEQKEDDWGREGDVWQQAAFTEQVISQCGSHDHLHTHVCVVLGASSTASRDWGTAATKGGQLRASTGYWPRAVQRYWFGAARLWYTRRNQRFWRARI
jgi:hypothetical protein